jgi:hypothetical protein
LGGGALARARGLAAKLGERGEQAFVGGEGSAAAAAARRRRR